MQSHSGNNLHAQSFVDVLEKMSTIVRSNIKRGPAVPGNYSLKKTHVSTFCELFENVNLSDDSHFVVSKLDSYIINELNSVQRLNLFKLISDTVMSNTKLYDIQMQNQLLDLQLTVESQQRQITMLSSLSELPE